MSKAILNDIGIRGVCNISGRLSFAEMGLLDVDLSGPQPVVIAEFGELGRDVVRFPMPDAATAIAVALMFSQARMDALLVEAIDSGNPRKVEAVKRLRELRRGA